MRTDIRASLCCTILRDTISPFGYHFDFILHSDHGSQCMNWKNRSLLARHKSIRQSTTPIHCYFDHARIKFFHNTSKGANLSALLYLYNAEVTSAKDRTGLADNLPLN